MLFSVNSFRHHVFQFTAVVVPVVGGREAAAALTAEAKSQLADVTGRGSVNARKSGIDMWRPRYACICLSRPDTAADW